MDARSFLRSKFIGPLPQEAGLSNDDVESYLRARLGLQSQVPVIEAPMITDVPEPDGASQDPAVSPSPAPSPSPADLGRSPDALTAQDEAQARMAAGLAPTPPPKVDRPAAPTSDRDKATNKSQVNDNATQSRRLNLMVRPEDFAAAVEQAKAQPEYQAQSQGIDQLQNMIQARMAAAKPQLDLTPLMSLTDTWTGSKMAGNYKAPKNDDADTIIAAQGKIQDDRRDLYKSILSAVTAQKGGGIFSEELARRALLAAEAGYAPTQPPTPGSGNRNLKDFATLWDRSAEYKEYAASTPKFQRAIQLLSKDTSAADSSFSTAFLRAIGDNRISNYDKTDMRYGLGGWGDKIDQLIEKAKDGKLSPKFRSEYMDILNGFVSARNEAVAGLRSEGLGLGHSMGVPQHQLDTFLNLRTGSDRKPAPVKGTPPGGAPKKDYSKMSLEELRAEKAKRSGQ